MPDVEKDTFKGYSTDSKLETIFDYIKGIHEKMNEQNTFFSDQRKVCDVRFIRIEKRKIINTGAAGAGGLVGGFIAVWTFFKMKIGG